MRKGFWIYGSAIALAAMLLAAPALAQFGGTTGSIFGTVVDEQGGVLPGVTVTLTGLGAPQTVTTDAKGQYRFINLQPGKWTVTLALTGFSSMTVDNTAVNVGGSTELNSKLKLSSVAASVTVTSEAPIIETRTVETGAAITHAELQDIPTARDPWVILQSVPGIQMDRVNVGGSESGQQSLFASKGTTGGTFSVDGVNFTDMSALGASAGYYDFDSFQEMNVVTGGSDPSLQGASVHLSMVTKRGTNEVHGSARLFVVSDKLESRNISVAEQAMIGGGNKINEIQDYGAELGGPIIKDRLWLWGSYGRDQINLTTAGGGPRGQRDRTTLEDLNGKLNAQIIASNAFNAWYLGSDKLKFGRNASPTRTQPTTWNQTTPNHTWKFEDSQVFSSNFFASASYNGSNGNFTLDPQGGANAQTLFDGPGIFYNTFVFYEAPRPQRQAKFDTSYFFNTGNLGHELKAGFSYLNASVKSQSAWPGFGPDFAAKDLAFSTVADTGAGCGEPCAWVFRNSNLSAENKYWSAYFGDTVTMDRLTMNLGVRWDHQYGINRASVVPANPSFPEILPAVNYPGESQANFTWNDWQPRIGVNYALGQNRTTVIKASYAQFADGLGTGTTSVPNPVQYTGAAYYAWNDANGDKQVQVSEVDLSNLLFHYNYNPADPGGFAPVNGINSKLKAPKTTEYLFGIDQEISPNLAVGVNYTYRKSTGQLYNPSSVYDPNTGTLLNSSDYEQYKTLDGVTPDGTTYSEPVYQIKQSVLEALGLCTFVGTPDESCTAPAGSYQGNRSGSFNTTYSGVEFVITKRLSNKWMMRGNFTYNDNVQHNPSPTSCIDPTNLLSGSSTNAQTCRNGDLVAVASGAGSGARANIFLNSKWMFSLNALYQLPYNFTIAGNFYGRQGYPINWWRRTGGAVDGLVRSVEVLPANGDRYSNVYELDLQVGYVVNLWSTATATLTGSCFNVVNSGTVLQRWSRLNRTNTGQTYEVMSPRVARFGIQISF